MTDFLETKPLMRVAEIRGSKALLPTSRGIYALFFDTPPGLTPIDGCYVRDNLSLLYIGTAGADLSKNGNLRKRLGGNHLGGNERNSTICQTLAALLPDIAGPAIAKDERGKIKFHTSKDGAIRVRNWMDEHVALCWLDYPDPAELEERLVRRYSPPLNIEFSEHPFTPKLKTVRAERRFLCAIDI